MPSSSKFAPRETRAFDRLLGFYESFVVFDTETTGLKAGRDRIVSYSLLHMSRPELRQLIRDGRNDVKTPDVYEIVNPGIYIPSAAVAVHGISNEEAARHPSLSKTHLEELFEYLTARTLFIGHNIVFDIGFLQAEVSRVFGGRSWWPKGMKSFCTMQRFRRHYPGRSSKLDSALKIMCIQGRVGAHHGADEDVRCTAALFVALATAEIAENEFEDSSRETKRINIAGVAPKPPKKDPRTESYVATRTPLQLAYELKSKLLALDGIWNVHLQHEPLHLQITAVHGLPGDALALIAPERWCNAYGIPFTLRFQTAPKDKRSTNPADESTVNSGLPPHPDILRRPAKRSKPRPPDRAETDCPYCSKTLRLPIGIRGGATCPSCRGSFYVNPAFTNPMIKHGVPQERSKTGFLLRRVTCGCCGQILRIPFKRKGLATCPKCKARTLFSATEW